MKTFEDQWERLRKKGKLHYILKQGVLFWGIPMSIVMNLYFHLRHDQPWAPTIYYVTAIFLIGGFIFGYVMWSVLEKRYQNQK